EMEHADFTHACPRLEEALRLEPSALGGRLKLAECYEGEGRLASAWTTYAFVEAEAARTNQVERAERAHQRADALRPRLATIALVIPPDVAATPGIEVTRDGHAVGRAQWGVP